MKGERPKSENVLSSWSFIEKSRAIIASQSPVSKSNNLTPTSSKKTEQSDNLLEIEQSIRSIFTPK
ncbi:MAG: hypothetical protein WC627_08970 [Legionella sp.]|jgi:hypothetical protein